MTKDKDTNPLVTKAEINQLLETMKGVKDQMKHEFLTEREAANKSLVKRIRLDCSLVFIQ